MNSVFKIFQELQNDLLGKSEGFKISSLPSVKNHKIGISPSGQPMFFIKCDNDFKVKTLDSNLEFISVQFNRECQLINMKSNVTEGVYTIVSLKTDSIDMQEYFLKIVFLIVKKLSETPKLIELKIEIEKLINLFSQYSKAPTKAIQGLWAELLVIEQSKNPDYVIKSWHSSVGDKFDFNDGIDKIEVKSTSKSRRVHNFSIEQLNPNKNSNLLIASIFAVETGVGKSVFDLISLIERKIRDNALILKVNEIVAQTLGKDIEKSFDIFYDYQLAIDTIQFYEFRNVPSVNINSIPKEVSNLRFDSDLTDVKHLVRSNKKSLLHDSLF